MRLAHEPDVAEPQVAQAAVDQLRRRARRAGAEVDALEPRNGADTLYTRLRGERDAIISKAAVIERAPATLDRLRRDGADALLFACTGAFPPMEGDAGVVFPSRILAGLSAGLLPRGRLGLLVPAPEQIEKLSQKWRRDGVEIVAEALIPSAGEAEAETAAMRLAEHRPGLVAMDCMSYTPAAKAAVRRAVRVPTLLAVTATAAVLRELLS
jgi:protein AroM